MGQISIKEEADVILQDPKEVPTTSLSKEEIDKLIIDNVKLAYWFAHQYDNIPDVPLDDRITFAKLALTKAAHTYDPTKGDFGKYASRVMRNYMNHLHYWDSLYAEKELKTLDSPLSSGDDEDGDSETTAKETVSYSPEYEKKRRGEYIVAREEAIKMLDDAINTLDGQEKELVQKWLNGKSYRDLADEYSISFVKVGYIIRQANEKMREFFRKHGVENISDILPESVESSVDKKTLIVELALSIMRSKIEG